MASLLSWRPTRSLSFVAMLSRFNAGAVEDCQPRQPGMRASSAERISAMRALARCFTLSLLS